jgi:hypothetical protein
MKKILFTIAVITASFTQAQQELKLDIFDALALKTIEITYERYIDEQSSFGISGLINFEKNSADFRYNEKRAITPFFRHYFTMDSQWNFFGEGFFSLNFGEKEHELIEEPSIYEDYTDGALGIAAGAKYISGKGMTVTLLAGAGRNFFSDNSPAVVPRIGVNVGWRF